MRRNTIHSCLIVNSQFRDLFPVSFHRDSIPGLGDPDSIQIFLEIAQFFSIIAKITLFTYTLSKFRYFMRKFSKI